MAYPCRCRKCKARRTLKHKPEWYLKEPTCHESGCDGTYRIDWYRYNKGARDQGSAELCKRDCRPYPHRTSDKQCRHYTEYVKARTKERSKHSPIPQEEWTPF